MTGEVIASQPQENLPPAVAELIDLFGPPPVLSTEDVQTYCKMLTALVRELEPPTFLGKRYVREIADTDWEIIRLMRQKVRGVDYSLYKHLQLRAKREKTKQDVKEGKKLPVQEAIAIAFTVDGPGHNGEPDEYDKAKAFLDIGDHYEMIDSMHNKAVARRAHLLREYEAYCNNLIPQLRLKVNEARLEAMLEDMRDAPQPQSLPQSQ